LLRVQNQKRFGDGVASYDRFGDGVASHDSAPLWQPIPGLLASASSIGAYLKQPKGWPVA